jgi:hypothetical protein
MAAPVSPADHAMWRRVLLRYALWCAGIALGCAAGLILSDPYDTGRLTPFPSSGVTSFDQHMAAASLGRQPGTTAAIVGNSTIQLVDPAELTATTGIGFVSLTVAGAGPLEQIAVARWFESQHAGESGYQVQALIFGLDKSWCRDDGRLEPINPFPFWLVGDSSLDYLAGMMRLATFGGLGRKLEVMLGWLKPPRADGYHDYDKGQPRNPDGLHREFAIDAYFYAPPTGREEFAALPKLQTILEALPASATAVLVFVPRHASSLPVSGSAEARNEMLCKQAFRSLAAKREKTAFVDLLQNDAMSRTDDNFFDQIHYRHSVAHAVATSIAGALREEATAR